MESSLERINAEMASIFEATSEGILVLDSERRLVRMNRRLHDPWRFPNELLQAGDGQPLLAWIAQRVKDPQGVEASFLKHFDDPELRTGGTLWTSEGVVFRWYASPQLLGDEIAGHVFGFSDLSPPQ
jgi:PAS domain-containing protein